MFIDADLRAMIVARFELVGTEETPGVPDTPAGLVAARSSALRELVRLIYDRSKFSPAAFAGERSSLALVVDAAEDHWQRMHAAALGFPAPPTGDLDAHRPDCPAASPLTPPRHRFALQERGRRRDHAHPGVMVCRGSRWCVAGRGRRT